MSKNKTCVVIFNSSWGEIDFVLPLIKYLKEKEINVISVFRNQKIFEERDNYKDLYKILRKNSKIINEDELINYNKIKIKSLILLILNFNYLKNKLKNFKFKKIKKYFQNIQKDNSEIFIEKKKKKNIVNYILCADFDSNYHNWINNFRNARFLLFPHAITLRGSEFEKYRNTQLDLNNIEMKIRIENLKKFPTNTILFGCNDDELSYLKNFTAKNIELKKIGFVRYNSEWMGYRNKLLTFDKQKNKSKNILLLVGKVNYIGEKELDNKIKDVIKICQKINYNILIKNHPRNSFNLKKYILIGKNIKIKEIHESIFSALSISEFMILTSKSGVCLDSIACGKIPLEYYRYNRNNSKNKFYEFIINDKVTSIYKYKKLIYSFDNYLSLKKFINDLSTNNLLKKKYFNKLRSSYIKIVNKEKKYFKNFTSIFE